MPNIRAPCSMVWLCCASVVFVFLCQLQLMLQDKKKSAIFGGIHISVIMIFFLSMANAVPAEMGLF